MYALILYFLLLEQHFRWRF